MSITIRVKATNGRIITLEVKPEKITVGEVKQQIFDKEEVPVEQQRLFYKGNLLDDNKSLKSYGITLENTVISLEVEKSRDLEYEGPTYTIINKKPYLIGGVAIGAGMAALTSTAISAALGYFAQGTAEQLGMAFGISIPVGALLGLIGGAAKFLHTARSASRASAAAQADFS